MKETKDNRAPFALVTAYNRGMSSEPLLSIAQIVPDTDAEGPGRRFAVWFQGCPLRCPGCCNPEFLPFRGGQKLTVAALVEQIPEGVEGVTLLGGEPFAHAAGAVEFATTVKTRDLSVMIFSGYTLAELRAMPDPAVDKLLRLTDILVDGPYRRDLPDTTRRWIGSTNQEIHFLTDRYQADDPQWRQRNTLEIRVVGGQISVNGFPAAGAVGLWKGWARRT